MYGPAEQLSALLPTRFGPVSAARDTVSDLQGRWAHRRPTLRQHGCCAAWPKAPCPSPTRLQHAHHQKTLQVSPEGRLGQLGVKVGRAVLDACLQQLRQAARSGRQVSCAAIHTRWTLAPSSLTAIASLTVSARSCVLAFLGRMRLLRHDSVCGTDKVRCRAAGAAAQHAAKAQRLQLHA
jgi:hypothetical protein